MTAIIIPRSGAASDLTGWLAKARALAAGLVANLISAMMPMRGRAAERQNDDADLARAASADFQRLILPHLDAAYSLARYLTRDATVSEDIVQEAFLKGFRAFSGFRGGDARAWILAIVRNAARDWQTRQNAERRRMVQPARSEDDEDLVSDWIERIASESASPETVLERYGEDARIRTVIERLPEPLREVLVLREMEDMSYREIAELTEVPLGTVMSRLSRARDAFAVIWARLESGRAAE